MPPNDTTPPRTAVLAAALFLAAALAGCATPAPTAPSTDSATLPCTPSLAFLAAGITSRQEAMARLGAPSSTWESGRILVYAILRDARGGFHVAWSEPHEPLARSHDLVLVFGRAERLERHALVPRQEE